MTKNGLTLSSLTHRHIPSDTSHLYSLIQAAETAGFIKVIRSSQRSAFLRVSTGSLGNPKCFAGLRTVSASDKGKSTARKECHTFSVTLSIGCTVWHLWMWWIFLNDIRKCFSSTKYHCLRSQKLCIMNTTLEKSLTLYTTVLCVTTPKSFFKV